ncbi:hypothetical protein [Corynebacterium flavescens]|uniref:hypothetical protein n=1 Tax=Corynebacterium flavescens TaxID=28028 RepID=UPI00257E1DD9|nr:hypothetical protein [Corynebacterium sp. UBA5992]
MTKMPKKLVRPRLEELTVGESGWIDSWDLYVREDFEVFLNPKADCICKSKSDEDLLDSEDSLFVMRTDQGYEVTLNHQTEWEREEDAEGLPVVAIHECY